jgi:sugar phosphate isomerase/epimerase
MQIGIFAKTFQRPTLEGVLDAVAVHGLSAVQFNMACAGLPSLPRDPLPDELIQQIQREMAARNITMSALSGTFNMIHPDPAARRAGFESLRNLAGAAGRLGTPMITLCTGSRDPDNMWRWHPDNGTPDAWRDLLESMALALEIADTFDITLGIEPEVSNVVDSAARARRLLDEFKSPRLKIVMDGANLFKTGMLSRMHEVLDEAFDLLGGDIGLVHAKDLSHDGAAGGEAAGTGALDYAYYLAKVRGAGYDGALILHGLREDQVGFSVGFLRAKIEANSE